MPPIPSRQRLCSCLLAAPLRWSVGTQARLRLRRRVPQEGVRERDEPRGHCVWGGYMSEGEALKAARGERVTFLLFSFAVVTGKPVPVAVGQAVAGAKELSGLLATPK